MKCVSLSAVAALAGLLWVGSARAETEAEYALPGAGGPGAAAMGKPGTRPALSRPAVRLPVFAPDAAKSAARLPMDQREERGFIQAAAASSRFGAEASKLALAKSASPGVRASATALIDRHDATYAELMQLLHVRGMAQPMLDNEHRKVLKRLGKLGGARFDRDYMEQVVLKQRRDDIRNYEKASLTATDPSLKAWVDRQLPTLRFQLVTAERAAAPGVRGQQGMARPISTRLSAPVNGSNSR